MPETPENERLQKKRAELLEKLLGNPTQEELNHLQLHLDALEKWKIVEAGHNDVDHGHQGEHEHDHHS
jgi:hypothetical protein